MSLSYIDIMNKLPIELQYIIASYLVPPIYYLEDYLTDTIHWEGLCLNPHPGMIPLIDAYFERCLTIQSYLDRTMLLRLHRNPSAYPLIEKYGYFFLNALHSSHSNSIPIQLCNPSQQFMEEIKNGTIRMKDVQPHVAEMVYAFPGIFQVDSVRTKAAIHQWIIYSIK